MYILLAFLVLLVGCQNPNVPENLELNETKECLTINDWQVVIDSSQSKTIDGVAYCSATKTETNQNGDRYLISVSGKSTSVLDRVNDPFFGINNQDAPLTTVQKEYLEKLESLSIDESLIGTRTINISINEVVQSAKGIAIPTGDVNFQMTGIAGTSISFNQGWCAGWTIVYTGVFDSPAGGQVDCVLSAAELWSSTYKTVTVSNDMTYQNNGFYLIKGYKFGWWNWLVQWSFDTNTNMCASISW